MADGCRLSDVVSGFGGLSFAGREEEEEENDSRGNEVGGSEEDDEEGASTVFGQLAELPAEPPDRRATCSRCGRPQKVCLCPFLPAHPLEVSTRLYIVQHPAEESRVLRTVPLLAACLSAHACTVLVGRRFPEDRFPELAQVCRSPNTLVLYPGPGAVDLYDLVGASSSTCASAAPESSAILLGAGDDSPAAAAKPGWAEALAPCGAVDPTPLADASRVPTPASVNGAVPLFTLVLIDGTWRQAKDMFERNRLLHIPRRVELRESRDSQYVIRSQPRGSCLSTLECAAFALAALERDPSIHETLLRPLRGLCSFQLEHGARVHHSKEHLLRSGLYEKPLPTNKRKLKRMQQLLY
ncbi:tRNA-uridine aminocarboxypropyltransferase 2 isoform X2 [Lethenteron reissneri]|uniref:tRNA-uridine aminocarboxypropyltransferase 2 isoform X2 n=1 Tax=Lethenteron reissneri TaxID=7753 RepID=UPI002AB7E0FE|nr:tRNA-uridine aminocarboxypropyltransferase 2 isoform X2 [Lethenteron reissneri]